MRPIEPLPFSWRSDAFNFLIYVDRERSQTLARERGTGNVEQL
ncbi:MAG: hypothetical protein SWY16_05275 [Cyanobacteriota bacterium]|nr:hypothetical protein [Cyanobacteriota bacterium]